MQPIYIYIYICIYKSINFDSLFKLFIIWVILGAGPKGIIQPIHKALTPDSGAIFPTCHYHQRPDWPSCPAVLTLLWWSHLPAPIGTRNRDLNGLHHLLLLPLLTVTWPCVPPRGLHHYSYNLHPMKNRPALPHPYFYWHKHIKVGLMGRVLPPAPPKELFQCMNGEFVSLYSCLMHT